MKTYLDCIPCFFRQALETARLVTSDEREIREVLNAVSSLIPDISLDASPPEIGRQVYRTINEVTGIEDPYQNLKEKYVGIATSLYPDLKRRVNSSDDRLLTAVRLSIAGNVIDFAANPRFQLTRDIEETMASDFGVFDYDEFRETLEEAEDILYLADNAGETVFDRVLVEEIGKPVRYVVRDRPVINDATAEDAVLSGLDRVAEIISSGCDAPGTVLKFCSREFLRAYTNADMVISKGQGNYEALSQENRPLFHLLKAKCPIIARDIGTQEGGIILMKARRET